MITVLVNPTAGGNTKADLASEISAAFDDAGASCHVVSLNAGDDVTAIAKREGERSDVVVAAGGDGTVNGVASALAGTETVLGVLPIGTLNHFARDMKLPDELDKAVATVVAGNDVRVDAAEVNGRLFINNSSIGVYPNAVEIREQLRRSGRGKWLAMATAMWRVLRTYRGVHVTLDMNGTRISARTPFVFVGNNEYVVEGLQIGARERLNGGQLFVYLAPRIRTRKLPWLLLRALAGRAMKAHDFEIVPTTELTIDTTSQRRVSVSLDGETTTLRMPLHYHARPGALRVIS